MSPSQHVRAAREPVQYNAGDFNIVDWWTVI